MIEPQMGGSPPMGPSLTSVGSASELLAVLGSRVSLVTVAVLEIVPGAVTVTTIVIVTESPAGIFPRLHVTTPSAVDTPWAGADERHSAGERIRDHDVRGCIGPKIGDRDRVGEVVSDGDRIGRVSLGDL
jgi:hypothetical protein